MAPFIDRNSNEGLHIGNTVDLVERWKSILYRILVKRNQDMVSVENCFPEFGTVSDGTPCCGNAEAIRQVAVTRKGEIIAPLVGFYLYEKSPNGSEHANHQFRSCTLDRWYSRWLQCQWCSDESHPYHNIVLFQQELLLLPYIMPQWKGVCHS